MAFKIFLEDYFQFVIFEIQSFKIFYLKSDNFWDFNELSLCLIWDVLDVSHGLNISCGEENQFSTVV